MRAIALTAAVLAASLLAMPVVAQAQSQETPAATPPGPRTDCTFDKAMVCKADGCNPSTTLGDLPLPARVLVDQASEVLAAVGPGGLPHISPIGSQGVTAGATVIAQGIDGAAGWMLHGSPDDPTTSFVVSSNHTVLVAFGSCKPVE